MRRLILLPAFAALLIGCSSSDTANQARSTETATQIAPGAITAVTAAPASPSPTKNAPTATTLEHLSVHLRSDFCGPGEKLPLPDGMPVVVKNEAGIIITNGVSSGHVMDAPRPLLPNGPAISLIHPCSVDVAIDVPAAQFYQITVGPYPLQVYSTDQLRAAGWHLELMIH